MRITTRPEIRGRRPKYIDVKIFWFKIKSLGYKLYRITLVRQPFLNSTGYTSKHFLESKLGRDCQPLLIIGRNEMRIYDRMFLGVAADKPDFFGSHSEWVGYGRN